MKLHASPHPWLSDPLVVRTVVHTQLQNKCRLRPSTEHVPMQHRSIHVHMGEEQAQGQAIPQDRCLATHSCAHAHTH
eukprot:3624450-Alexandrium_andersonii.AAC.1